MFKVGGRTISFEFFPPRTEQGEESLFKSIEQLKMFQPNYVSVTYGAGGSTRDKTLDIVARIKKETDLEVMAHLTCSGQTKDQVHSVLLQLEEMGIENVLALRGDPPKGQDRFVPQEGGFEYTSELITHIKQNFAFCIGGAGFPEGHLESPDLETDTAYLKMKVDSGAEFIITQLFFDNADFLAFMDRVDRADISVPVIAGVLPILSTGQIRRFTALCGAKIPPELDARLERYADDDDAVREIGVEQAAKQVEELWRNGVDGVHFYSLNKSYSVSRSLDTVAQVGSGALFEPFGLQCSPQELT